MVFFSLKYNERNKKLRISHMEITFLTKLILFFPEFYGRNANELHMFSKVFNTSADTKYRQIILDMHGQKEIVNACLATQTY